MPSTWLCWRPQCETRQLVLDAISGAGRPARSDGIWSATRGPLRVSARKGLKEMSSGGERWFDQEAGPLVRLYALTRGRTRPVGPVLDVVDVLETVGPPAALAHWLPPEHRRLLELCSTPVAVADLASETGLPLGVVQVLLGDLHQRGLVSVVGTAKAHTQDESVLRKVLDGLRAL